MMLSLFIQANITVAFDEKVKAVLSPAQSAAYVKERKAGRFSF